MKRILLGVFLLGLVMALCGRFIEAQESTAASTDDDPARWLIFVCQDECAIEEQIAQYLKAKDGWDADYKYGGENKDDLWLELRFTEGDAPQVRVTIDTFPSNTQNSKVVERVISVKSWYILPDRLKKRDELDKILRFNNEYMVGHWMPMRIVLDKDDDIMIQSVINICAENVPLHCENVRDIVIRQVMGWADYYPKLKEVVDL